MVIHMYRLTSDKFASTTSSVVFDFLPSGPTGFLALLLDYLFCLIMQPTSEEPVVEDVDHDEVGGVGVFIITSM